MTKKSVRVACKASGLTLRMSLPQIPEMPMGSFWARTLVGSLFVGFTT